MFEAKGTVKLGWVVSSLKCLGLKYLGNGEPMREVPGKRSWMDN